MNSRCIGMDKQSLLDIIERKKLKTLIPAPWQRDDIWTKNV